MTTRTTTKPSWDDLAAANQRARQSETLEGVAPHQPEVAVLTCADARVSAARMFDLPPGALFVVRVAGASATVEAIAGLTFSAVTNTCGMAMALAKLPYNRGASCDMSAVLDQLTTTEAEA